jgi:NTP pyrophosphatase (non-canonical NTP hydrolase)
MTFETYEEIASSTRDYGVGEDVIYPVLGLNGEAGEVAEKVKKVLRDKQGVYSQEDKDEIEKELGDCLWYIAAISKDIGSSLYSVAQTNLYKILARRQNGTIHGNGDSR